MAARVDRFTVLVYRMPAKPTAARVAVWRQLKKSGAIYLQQSVCVFPDNRDLRKDLEPTLERITTGKGEYHLLPLRSLDDAEEAKLIQQFQQQTSNHYQEIIENCEVNFTKEIEFETFRKNFTYEEAEEIRAEFEKIGAWYERVLRRDWFGAPNQSNAKAWIDRCEAMLEEFEAKVFERQDKLGEDSSAADAPSRRRSRHRPRVVAGSQATNSHGRQPLGKAAP
ncbi:MAG TPA: Chromate resistance protein ChrB [Candidatus Dormibacteraeota bacterium]